MAEKASCSMEASYLMTMRVVSLPLGREERAWEVGLEGSRFRAMTVWGGFNGGVLTRLWAIVVGCLVSDLRGSAARGIS